jgi:hypothetical protein
MKISSDLFNVKLVAEKSRYEECANWPNKGNETVLIEYCFACLCKHGSYFNSICYMLVLVAKGDKYGTENLRKRTWHVFLLLYKKKLGMYIHHVFHWILDLEYQILNLLTFNLINQLIILIINTIHLQ